MCPVGYQIPTKEDWEELALVYSNGNESNLTDYFRLLPGGVRAADGTFSGDGLKAVLWSSHEYSATDEALAFTFFMDNKELIGTVASKSAQVSIRCIKAH